MRAVFFRLTGRLACCLLMGIAAGYVIGCSMRLFSSLPCFRSSIESVLEKVRASVLQENENFEHYTDKNLVLVGVMTAKDLLQTRAITAHDTWAKNFPGKVLFFTPEDVGEFYADGLDIVQLKGVTDDYPPQKKSFLMLKYMYDNYIDKFRFFLRADDDAYVKGDELIKFLHSVVANGIPVIGSPGFGREDEFGKMFLRNEENYCMGGPGMIIPREILGRVGPNIKHCLKNLYTTHEDVEIGRCFTKVANSSCTWSYQKLFYQNYKDLSTGFNHSLEEYYRDISRAITLHPLKLSEYMYRMHEHLLKIKARKLYSRVHSLEQEVNEMNRLLLFGPTNSLFGFRDAFRNYSDERRPGTAYETRPWIFFSRTSMSTPSNSNPNFRIVASNAAGMDDTNDQIWDKMFAKNLRGDLVTGKDFTFLYSQVRPEHGHDYIVTLSEDAWAIQTQPSSNSPRQNVYVHRPLYPMEMIEDTRIPEAADTRIENVMTGLRVNVVVPLAGRYSRFLTFIKIFEDSCLKTGQNVSLSIMLFKSDPNEVDSSGNVVMHMRILRLTYRDVPLDVVHLEGEFSRGRALQKATERFRDDDLLLFIDIDVPVQPATLQRIRLNTILGKSVYAPAVFFHYYPGYFPQDLSDHLELDKTTVKHFDQYNGYWNRDGFGTLSCYKADFDKVGGFAQDIKGWGMEDIDLIEKFISSGVSVFRSADVQLVHQYHPFLCDKDHLDKAHYDMCMNKMFITMASTEIASNIVYKTPDIYNRGKKLENNKTRVQTARSGLKNVRNQLPRKIIRSSFE